MNGPDILPISSSDLATDGAMAQALLALNNAHAQELSWLEPDRLGELVAKTFRATRIGTIDAFLLAFDQGASYDNPNFRWFAARYPRFVYIDRIVVAPSARGRGLAKLLYQDLFGHASRAGQSRVVCEVNSRPPNPESDAFHSGLGFVEIGSADIHDGRKTVRYLSLAL
jgi:uncharacterized protein